MTTNSITDLFQIRLPVIQAPMAGAQDHRLAVAVSVAGGLGSLPCAMLDVEGVRSEVGHFRGASRGPLNLNFFCHSQPERNPERERAWQELLAPYFEEFAVDIAPPDRGAGRQPFSATFANLVEEIRPEVVSFHFGLPGEELLAKVRGSGARIIATATTVREALWLEAKGVDAVIAQGAEAGGHRGNFLSDDITRQVGTFALLPQVVREVKVPVIAAGGIAGAEGVAAAMKLGAAGVQIGTAYLLCSESTISPLHRAALQSEQRQHTAMTNVFTGRPARGIVNRLMRELGPMHSAVPEFPLAAPLLAALRKRAESEGNSDFSPLWAGQNTDGCRAVSATELTRDLFS